MSLSLNGSDLQSRSYSFPIEEKTQVGEARRFAATLAHDLGFEETRMARVGILVNELGNNLVAYAPGGELLIRVLPHPNSNSLEDARGIEILSVDRGTGIPDMQRSMEDGFSTGSTPGTGLGAVRRQADVFDLYSKAQADTESQGTVVVAQIFKSDEAAREVLEEPFRIGVVNLPIHGEKVCGDSFLVNFDLGELNIVVADGLGHGKYAAEAALAAVDMFFLNHNEPTENLVQLIHGRLRSTRGAAIFVVKTDGDSVSSSGIGNIRAVIEEPTKQRTLISQNGTAGLQIRSARALKSDWDRESLLILHSDGVGSKWNLGNYPGLRFKHPSLIAGVVNRDFSRGRDDSTVVVIGAQA